MAKILIGLTIISTVIIHQCNASYTLLFENVNANSINVTVQWQLTEQTKTDFVVLQLDQVVFSEMVSNNTSTEVNSLTPNTQYCVCVNLTSDAQPQCVATGDQEFGFLCQNVTTVRGRLFALAVGSAIFLAVSFIVVVIADVIWQKTQKVSKQHRFDDLIKIGRQEYHRQTTRAGNVRSNVT